MIVSNGFEDDVSGVLSIWDNASGVGLVCPNASDDVVAGGDSVVAGGDSVVAGDSVVGALSSHLIVNICRI